MPVEDTLELTVSDSDCDTLRVLVTEPVEEDEAEEACEEDADSVVLCVTLGVPLNVGETEAVPVADEL